MTRTIQISQRWLWLGACLLIAVVLIMFTKLFIEGIVPGLAIWKDPCIIETKKIIANPSGLDFEILDTDCDAMVKWETMSIFVARAGSKVRTEIFKFDPTYYVPLPEIKVVPSEKRIVISVAKIGSIYFQKYRWENMTVDYKIDEIAYPDSVNAASAPPAKPH